MLRTMETSGGQRHFLVPHKHQQVFILTVTWMKHQKHQFRFELLNSRENIEN